MKIAILLTDTDVSEFANRYADDAQKFVNLIKPLRPDWQFVRYAARDNVFPAALDPYDGIIITGSPASVNDDLPWIARLMEVIREADRRRLPMVGACFGHQAIAKALGGEVRRNPKGWGLGTVTTSFVTPMPWMQPWQDDMRFWRAHNEIVTRLPKGAVSLGHDPLAEISAYSIGTHVFTTQHHPEITPDYMQGLLEVLADSVETDLLAEARSSCDVGAEGTRFAEWIAKFFELPKNDEETS